VSDPARPTRPDEEPNQPPLPEEPPIQEPEPDRLPDEMPNPNPDESPQPPLHALAQVMANRPLYGRPFVCVNGGR
jgi:hypothetical protein